MRVSIYKGILSEDFVFAQRLRSMELSKEHFRAFAFIESERGCTPIEIYEQLLEAHVKDPPSRATVFRWCKDFTDGTRTSLFDAPRPGRPVTATSED